MTNEKKKKMTMIPTPSTDPSRHSNSATTASRLAPRPAVPSSRPSSSSMGYPITTTAAAAAAATSSSSLSSLTSLVTTTPVTFSRSSRSATTTGTGGRYYILPIPNQDSKVYQSIRARIQQQLHYQASREAAQNAQARREAVQHARMEWEQSQLALKRMEGKVQEQTETLNSLMKQREDMIEKIKLENQEKIKERLNCIQKEFDEKKERELKILQDEMLVLKKRLEELKGEEEEDDNDDVDQADVEEEENSAVDGQEVEKENDNNKQDKVIVNDIDAASRKMKKEGEEKEEEEKDAVNHAEVQPTESLGEAEKEHEGKGADKDRDGERKMNDNGVDEGGGEKMEVSMITAGASVGDDGKTTIDVTETGEATAVNGSVGGGNDGGGGLKRKRADEKDATATTTTSTSGSISKRERREETSSGKGVADDDEEEAITKKRKRKQCHDDDHDEKSKKQSKTDGSGGREGEMMEVQIDDVSHMNNKRMGEIGSSPSTAADINFKSVQLKEGESSKLICSEFERDAEKIIHEIKPNSGTASGERGATEKTIATCSLSDTAAVVSSIKNKDDGKEKESSSTPNVPEILDMDTTNMPTSLSATSNPTETQTTTSTSVVDEAPTGVNRQAISSLSCANDVQSADITAKGGEGGKTPAQNTPEVDSRDAISSFSTNPQAHEGDPKGTASSSLPPIPPADMTAMSSKIESSKVGETANGSTIVTKVENHKEGSKESGIVSHNRQPLQDDRNESSTSSYVSKEDKSTLQTQSSSSSSSSPSKGVETCSESIKGTVKNGVGAKEEDNGGGATTVANDQEEKMETLLESERKTQDLKKIKTEVEDLNKAKSQMIWLLKQVITAEKKRKEETEKKKKKKKPAEGDGIPKSN